MAQNGTLTTKKRRAIEALISSPTITEAADNAKVGRRTLHRWLDEDEAFRLALASAETKLLSTTARRLVAGNMQALDVLADLMANAESDMVRLRAARAWLDVTIRWREITSIEERITRLEAQLR